MTASVLFFLLGVGVLNIFLTIYLFRRIRSAPVRSGVSGGDMEAQTERMLTEIHRVTSANVELLEARIDALREVGVLADERLRRIRGTLTDLEVLLNRIHRIKKSMDEPSGGFESREVPALPVVESAAQYDPPPAVKSRQDAAHELRRQGLTEQQIAQKIGLGIAEVRFLLKLAEGGRLPVESR